ncbi:hypothetical protein THER_1656 [Thermodesulfovibrio sp. N1]|uniref:hypothetical protein n=1 Tax=unclassified Thermodesulfovibrio TaxID=2645936 RepID=UPI00083AC857|nr:MULTISPECIES: hypothetical protein [unclassified Thermodesulfovibrio]MDI1471918.1 hypothetical protein [Thermodesulfovibrio sp. 1176]ODA43617.1 hypothetical protein THER_1656 [Thermodesulfovibrio sp. N1]
MSERVMLKGYLADARKRYREKDLEASGLLVAIRNLLNPYEEDMTLIDSEKALIMMQRLNECISDMKELKEKIAKLERELNG